MVLQLNVGEYVVANFKTDGLLVYFTLSNHQFDEETLHIFLEEKNLIPDEHSGQKILSKGFFEPITIQDFPIRGRNVFLHIKRRK
jgi:hypothetical protein